MRVGNVDTGVVVVIGRVQLQPYTLCCGYEWLRAYTLWLRGKDEKDKERERERLPYTRCYLHFIRRGYRLYFVYVF